MNAKRFLWLAALAAMLLALVACSSPAEVVEVTRVVTETEVVEMDGETVEVAVADSDTAVQSPRGTIPPRQTPTLPRDE